MEIEAIKARIEQQKAENTKVDKDIEKLNVEVSYQNFNRDHLLEERAERILKERFVVWLSIFTVNDDLCSQNKRTSLPGQNDETCPIQPLQHRWTNNASRNTETENVSDAVRP